MFSPSGLEQLEDFGPVSVRRRRIGLSQNLVRGRALYAASSCRQVRRKRRGVFGFAVHLPAPLVSKPEYAPARDRGTACLEVQSAPRFAGLILSGIARCPARVVGTQYLPVAQTDNAGCPVRAAQLDIRGNPHQARHTLSPKRSHFFVRLECSSPAIGYHRLARY